MHIIYFDRHNKRITLKLTKLTRGLLFTLLVSTIMFCGYYGFLKGLNKNLDQKTQNNWIKSWSAELIQHKKNLTTAKTESEMHLNALAEEIAKLQAHVARLDALGLHISKIAQLDTELFNFTESLSEQDLYTNDVDHNSTDNSNLEHNNSMNYLGLYEHLSNNINNLDNQLNLLQSVLKYQKLDRQTLVKGKPIHKGYISSYYGYRNHPIKKRRIFHRGIDFVSKKGTPVMAVASGVVIWAGVRGGFGNLVEINHGDGYSTRYAHNDKVLVNVGDLVNKGDPVAKMGSTGKSTGTHVHFEVWRNGKSENPIGYLSKK